jgi:hypothetical protein
MSAYDDIRAERARQVKKGRDAAHDDARTHGDWITCLCLVAGYTPQAPDWRRMWVKIGAVAIAAIEAHDRQDDTLDVAPLAPPESGGGDGARERVAPSAGASSP